MNIQFTLRVEDAADEFGIRNLLIVQPDGSITYDVQSNREMPDSQEIGLYEAKLNDSDLRQVGMVFGDPIFQQMEDHWGKVISGEVVRVITIEQETGEETRKLISMERTAPPQYEPARNSIDHLMAEAIKNPLSVLSIDVQWPQENIKRDTPSPIVLTLQNNGTEKIVFSNPLKKMAADPSILSLRAQRSDIDIMEMQEYHHIQQDLSREDLKRSDKIHLLDEDTVTLHPKRSITLYFSIPFDWPPGKYTVQLIWEHYGNEGNSPSIIGILYSLNEQIEITGVSKPGDEQLDDADEFDDDDDEQ